MPSTEKADAWARKGILDWSSYPRKDQGKTQPSAKLATMTDPEAPERLIPAVGQASGHSIVCAPDSAPDDSSSPKQPKSAEPVRHFLYIDSLRGIAVALVIAVHVSLFWKVQGLLGTMLQNGNYGVQLFYLVSALTLMMSMAQRSRAERNPTLNFFIRRFFRIAPAFYIVLIAYSLLSWKNYLGFLPVSRVTLPQLLVVMSFFNGWRPDLINNAPVIGQWSIAVEMMFYVTLPCLFVYIQTSRGAVYAWWGSILISLFSYPLAARLAALEGFSGDAGKIHVFAYRWFPTQLPVFITGISLYFIIAEKQRLSRSIVPYLPGLLLILILHHFYPDVPLAPVVGVAGAIFVTLVARFSPRIFVNRFTAFLGKVSFSAYLCHPLILVPILAIFPMTGARNPLIKFAAVYVITLPCVCVVSQLIWKWIERPGQRLGKLVIVHLAQIA
jgi:peptidoglycan/LPS O-acetylase OafA/YrhL